MHSVADLMTTREVADYLGVSVWTVGRRVHSGILPVAKELPGNQGKLFHRQVVDLLATQLRARKGPGAAPLSAPDPDALDPLQKEGDASQ